MSDITHASILEVQALLKTLIYTQAQILAKQSDKSADELFDSLMEYNTDQFKKLAVPSQTEKKQKKTD